MRSIRNCSVAVVGGAGFLGSHVVDHLIEDRACDVLVIDNLVSGRREFIHPKVRFEHADITSSEVHLANLFEWAKVRFVLNYAARPYVPDSYARPLRTFDVNAMGALKVMNAAQDAGVEGILQVSSAELYGGYSQEFVRSCDQQPMVAFSSGRLTEAETVVPHSTYGAAKAAIDALVQVRWREAGTPCIALRQFNCVGERETHPYVIPEIIGQLEMQRVVCPRCNGEGDEDLSREPCGTEKTWCRLCEGKGMAAGSAIVRLGNNAARDFLYAGDQARLAVELLERGNFGEVYNLGSESSIRVYDLARMIGKLMGFADIVVQEDESRKRKWEIWSLCSDNSKLYGVVEARPTVSLEEALRRAIAWYEANGRKWPWER